MGVFLISEPARVRALFSGWPETFIWSYLDGCMGAAWATDPDTPRSAKIMAGDFCLFAGEPDAELILHQPAGCSANGCILVPQNAAWSRMIAQVGGRQVQKITRFATRKDPACFHRETLARLAVPSDPAIRLCMIDAALFEQLRSNEWSYDLCSQFQTYAAYSRHGIGVAALCGGEPVAGASSYTFYRGGIEIEIDTREDFRRRGLATACGASLILACLERGLYPSWDAHDAASLALAEKLGYQLDQPYTAYEWDSCG